MYALVFKEKVIQIEEEPFPVHEALQWIRIPSGIEVEVGYGYVSEEFVPPEEEEPIVIPDTVFQKATKIMIKAMMGFINGTLSKTELNNIFDNVKEYLKEISNA